MFRVLKITYKRLFSLSTYIINYTYRLSKGEKEEGI